MFTEVGKFAIKYVFAYAFLSSVFVSLFYAYGLNPPEPLTVMPLNVQKLVESSSAVSNPTYAPIYPVILANFFAEVLTKLFIGLPVLFYKLSIYSGQIWLVTSATALGVFIQFSVYVYVANVVAKYIFGSGEEI